MSDQLAPFTDQLDELARYARSINFDIENGDIQELVRLWIASTAPLYALENREKVLKIVKGYAKG